MNQKRTAVQKQYDTVIHMAEQWMAFQLRMIEQFRFREGPEIEVQRQAIQFLKEVAEDPFREL